MESNSFKDTSNETLRKRLMKCIKNREIDELIKILDSIKPDKQSQIFLNTGADDITCLSYAIKHKIPENIIEQMVEIPKKGGILKQVLETKNRHGNTALDFAKKYHNKKIVKLILNEEQGSGVVSHIEYNGKTIVMSGNTGISMGNTIKIFRKKTQQEKTYHSEKLTQVCSGSTPNLSITTAGSSLNISHASGVHICDKGITVKGKKLL